MNKRCVRGVCFYATFHEEKNDERACTRERHIKRERAAAVISCVSGENVLGLTKERERGVIGLIAEL